MLIRDVEVFLRKTNMAPTRLGRMSVGDPRFVGDLRVGRLPRPETERRVRAFMEDNQ